MREPLNFLCCLVHGSLPLAVLRLAILHRPSSYKAYGSSKEDNPACDYPGFENTDMELVRHVSFVDCPGETRHFSPANKEKLRKWCRNILLILLAGLRTRMLLHILKVKTLIEWRGLRIGCRARYSHGHHAEWSGCDGWRSAAHCSQ